MLPIFAYYRTEMDDGERIGLKPANKAARQLLPSDTIVSKALANWEFNRAELDLLAKAIPPCGEACLVPEDLTANRAAINQLVPHLCGNNVLRTRDAVSFIIDAYQGKLAIRYRAHGRIDFVALRADVDQSLWPGITCITDFQQLETETVTFVAPPAPFNADLATLEASFWNKVNPTLIDPFIRDARDAYVAKDDVVFAKGSEKALCHDVELLCYAWLARMIDVGRQRPDCEFGVFFHAQSEEKDGFWASGISQLSGMTAPLLRALHLVGKENPFTGSSVYYNDGSYVRHSGYDRDPAHIQIRIAWTTLTAHEQLACHGDRLGAAVAWLKEHQFSDQDISTIFSAP